MKDFKRVEDLVRDVLERIPEARKDDFILVVQVYEKIIPNICELPFATVMCEHKELGLPYFETIRRTRQKLQAENMELRPSENVIIARTNKQSEYINYSIDGYDPKFMKFVDSQK